MSTALVKVDVQELAGRVVRSPQEMAAIVRAVEKECFVLGAMAPTFGSGFTATVVPVVISTDMDANGVGQDVYHQRGIHKAERRGRGDAAVWEPVEVSLSKNGLIKLMAAAGVKIDYRASGVKVLGEHHWLVTTGGSVVDFDGSERVLPPGSEEVDLRDGSAQIGGWTPQEWAIRVDEADRLREKTPKDSQWKIKPEPIGGWTWERVMQARKKGLRIAEAKSLTALIRNLGVKQKYTIEELQKKPFILFRSSFTPDMTDPVVRRMVTAKHLGALDALYGPSPDTHGLPATTPVDPGVIEAERVDDTTAEASRGDETTSAALAAPAEALEIDDIPEVATATERRAGCEIRKLSQVPGQPTFFIDTDGGTFKTDDPATARVLNTARKEKRRYLIDVDAHGVIINAEPAEQKY